ncbi:hypothetical protein V2A60_010332 [Cordyceps javanica]|uniref:Protein kinase n=1 Tax=Cordyceps javanica TaxID=43265 RepID=A0A545UUT5_9HYPO|nr:protein kinase [Cordyceps javanica]TQW05406.1 protein kinase [Cordyceps javanica]
MATARALQHTPTTAGTQGLLLIKYGATGGSMIADAKFDAPKYRGTLDRGAADVASASIIVKKCHRDTIVEVLPPGDRVKKSPQPQECTSESKRQARQLMREVKVYGRLPSHKRLLTMISYSDDGPNSYIIFEHLSRGTLEAYLASTAHVTPEQQLTWCIEATEGVAFLHDFGIIHGDIKPQNMLLDSDMSIRIIDFAGSSVDGLKPLCLESTRYFLPRPMDSDMPCNTLTDLFALGSSLYHIMQRAPPYSNRQDDEVVRLYTRQSFPELRDVACGGVINSCWRQELPSANTVLALLHAQHRPVHVFSSLFSFGFRFLLILRSWYRWGVARPRLFRKTWFEKQ